MTERTFTAFTEANLLEGGRLCFANAEVHFECADHIATLGHYGMASSHLVLAAEEAVKSFVCWAKLFGLDMPDKVDKYFSQHSPRHNAARELYSLFRDVLAIQDQIKALVPRLGIAFVTEQLDKGITLDEHFIQTTLVEALAPQVALETGRLLLEQKASHDLYQERIDRKWWNNANGLKNRGFYVDHEDNKGWLLPQQISKAEYQDSRERVDRVLTVLEQMARFDLDSLTQFKTYLAMSKPTTLELFETAPNGTRTDIVYLTKVPSVDGSDFEYLVEFEELEGVTERMEIGRVGLIDGKLWLSNDHAQITYKGMLLLSTWIEEHLEDAD
ncbi:hypothetical protein FAES_3942 [Fibrella aestuarina BUZ 2]|uniref:AbiV family abortive infection protein n=1 Tax=Fibrella aestuarina BUZ 2 TaxID=1166018 RepID=I0KCU5_9BACT|nr:AbiV family abortive infection protein [Fibrella aestuarina]CCH01948.1 hypothetical protein FAES_3942 [Fibrella aestuarina BUZ 2]